MHALSSGLSQAAANVFFAQRSESAGPDFAESTLESAVDVMPQTGLDVDEATERQLFEAAEVVARRFPVLLPGEHPTDVIRIRNFNISDVIRVHALSDVDRRSDSILSEPSRKRARASEDDTDFQPRRSKRIAGLPAACAPSSQQVQKTSVPLRAAKPRASARPAASRLPDAPSWSFAHRVLAQPTVYPALPAPATQSSSSQEAVKKGRRAKRNAAAARYRQAEQGSEHPPECNKDVDAIGTAGSIRPSAALGCSLQAQTPATPSAPIVEAAVDSAGQQPRHSSPAQPLGLPQPPSSPTFDFHLVPVVFDRSGLRFLPEQTRRSRNKSHPPSASFPPVPSASTEQSEHEQPRRRLHHGSAYYDRRRTEYYATLVVEALLPAEVTDEDARPRLVIETLNRSAPGWQGSISRKLISQVLALWGTPRLSGLLRGLHLVPFRGLNTTICDMNRRSIVLRSTPIRDAGLIESFTREAYQLSIDCPIPASDRKSNRRGEHWACVAGAHRQYTKKAHLTRFQIKYSSQIEHFFRHDGPADRITRYLTSIMRSRLPEVVTRMEANHQWHYENTKDDATPLRPMFGLFWNFCVNVPSPSEGVLRVCCRPHADQKNCAVLMCAVFFFWPEDAVGEDEWSWLVIWELGIILQCPRGSFVIYPSALLFHFNVRIVKCKKGQAPSPDNSADILGASLGGRGSSVWFCQASMYSVTHERDVNGFLPNYDELAARCFPIVVTDSPDSRGAALQPDNPPAGEAGSDLDSEALNDDLS
ncbi:hypothetical protein AURDEDRAFT_177791 [Auricularia subglabra TFB-10046 SS5]|uniref:Uncharacterized protein n=1 Tax=Auricularia subglabra (strain TFB-10046 / SS5) TaxID=717982 RepID=J0WLD7_AURST|nr:hypothetical protein AURDEDRAFT_177791 [Auricularia subglabra TFB-10046 SS5]